MTRGAAEFSSPNVKVYVFRAIGIDSYKDGDGDTGPKLTVPIIIPNCGWIQGHGNI